MLQALSHWRLVQSFERANPLLSTEGHSEQHGAVAGGFLLWERFDTSPGAGCGAEAGVMLQTAWGQDRLAQEPSEGLSPVVGPGL